MDETEVRYFVEAALLAAGRPLSVDQLHALFEPGIAPEKAEIRKSLDDLNIEFEPRGISVVEVASGFRIQVKAGMVERLQKLWEERPPRYSRALFETLALVAYRQPITRGEIEEIRGVSVSSNIVRSLLEREWIRVVGHRDVPGRPAMFGTTKLFLDYFGLKKLDDLPPLADLSDWESLRVQLNLPDVDADATEDDDGMPGEVAAIPVLFPQGTNDPEFADLAEGESEQDPISDGTDPEQSGVPEEFTEIAATEWPDPMEEMDESADDDMELGADAAASRQ